MTNGMWAVVVVPSGEAVVVKDRFDQHPPRTVGVWTCIWIL